VTRRTRVLGIVALVALVGGLGLFILGQVRTTAADDHLSAARAELREQQQAVDAARDDAETKAAALDTAVGMRRRFAEDVAEVLDRSAVLVAGIDQGLQLHRDLAEALTTADGDAYNVAIDELRVLSARFPEVEQDLRFSLQDLATLTYNLEEVTRTPGE
jgi:hypothetical protein